MYYHSPSSYTASSKSPTSAAPSFASHLCFSYRRVGACVAVEGHRLDRLASDFAVLRAGEVVAVMVVERKATAKYFGMAILRGVTDTEAVVVEVAVGVGGVVVDMSTVMKREEEVVMREDVLHASSVGCLIVRCRWLAVTEQLFVLPFVVGPERRQNQIPKDRLALDRCCW